MMAWWWAHDERGEQLLNAQEVYTDMISYPRINERQILIEAIENWLKGEINA